MVSDTAGAEPLYGMPVIFTPAPVVKVVAEPEEVVITKENKVWHVRHSWLVRQMDELNLESADAVVRLHRILDDLKVITRLREMGVEDGDTIAIGDFEFKTLLAGAESGIVRR